MYLQQLVFAFVMYITSYVTFNLISMLLMCDRNLILGLDGSSHLGVAEVMLHLGFPVKQPASRLL